MNSLYQSSQAAGAAAAAAQWSVQWPPANIAQLQAYNNSAHAAAYAASLAHARDLLAVLSGHLPLHATGHMMPHSAMGIMPVQQQIMPAQRRRTQSKPQPRARARPPTTGTKVSAMRRCRTPSHPLTHTPHTPTPSQRGRKGRTKAKRRTVVPHRTDPTRVHVHCVNMCGVLYCTKTRDADKSEWTKVLRRLNAHESKRCRRSPARLAKERAKEAQSRGVAAVIAAAEAQQSSAKYAAHAGAGGGPVRAVAASAFVTVVPASSAKRVEIAAAAKRAVAAANPQNKPERASSEAAAAAAAAPAEEAEEGAGKGGGAGKDTPRGANASASLLMLAGIASF